jgi:isopropylmalate/homocitrate/citramalate synthase
MINCSRIIRKNILACPKKTEIFNKIDPNLFDVSLRDGIQNANIENFPTSKKMEIFQTIYSENLPKRIEIGSLTSQKIFPIMNDSIEMFNYAKEFLKIKKSELEFTRDLEKYNNNFEGIYLLIPSLSKLHLALNHNIRNFSFITSVSNKFQVSNTKKSIWETKQEFKKIFDILNREHSATNFTQLKNSNDPHVERLILNHRGYKTKLYISCINKCPIIGKIDNDFILKEVLYYHGKFQFDEICLSDTVGELKFDDFEYIIQNCIFFGIPPSKISLHLHYKPYNYRNIQNILFYCFKNKINKFDVSMLDTGGCSVTMRPEQRPQNLSYDMFYVFLDKYINDTLLESHV